MVVAFHARLPGFAGGFVGVDVFFVISGYLITRLLLREVQSNEHIDFARFYARRARRILPALALLLAVMVAVVWPLLTTEWERRGLAYSIAAASFFSANVLFYLRAQDYFADRTNPDPLTHTWSLSVEEQFYLLWPAVLALVAAVVGRRFRSRAMLALILMVCAASATSAWLGRHNPDWVFYLPFARLWELGLGAALAWIVERGELPRIANWIVVLSLGCLGLSAFLIGRTAPREPWMLLLPTVTTLVVLAGIEAGESAASRLLAIPVMQMVGRVSYGWYLWHFPALVLVSRYVDAKWAPYGAVAWSLGAAYVSFRFVEDPIRRRVYGFAQRDRTVLLAGGGLLILFLGAGAALRYKASTSPDVFQARRSHIAWIRERCPGLSLHDAMRGESCPLGSDSARRHIRVIGDSHAARVVSLMDAFGKQHNVGVAVSSFSGCAPLLSFRSPLYRDPQHCLSLVDSVLNKVHDHGVDAVTGVVLVARWSYVFGTPPRDTAAQIAFFDLPGSIQAAEVATLADSALRETVVSLTARGVRVLLVAQPPEWNANPRRCAVGRHECREAYSEIRMHSARSVIALQRAGRDSGVRVLMLEPLFCNATYCDPFRNGKLAFDDADHLSIDGAVSLLPDVDADLMWVAGLNPAAAGSVPHSSSHDCRSTPCP